MGIHVLHILGRLEAGGGVSCEIGGGQMESHILRTPCPLVPRNGGSGEGGKIPRALQDLEGLFPRPTCSLFSPLVEVAGGSRELGVRGLEGSHLQRTYRHTKGLGRDALYSRPGQVATPCL